MAYTTVTPTLPFQVLTSTLMNQMIANDVAFRSGNGVLPAGLGLSSGFSGGVASQANAGSAGGTIYYVNLGGIKLAWGISATISTSTTTPGKVVTLPPGFFSSLQTSLVCAVNMGSVATQYASVAGYSSPDLSVYIFTTAGTGTAQFEFILIGT